MNIFEEFDKYNTEDPKDSIAFTNTLIEVALQGEHTPLDFIRNLSQKAAVKTLITAHKKLARGFNSAAELSYKEYLDKLKQGIDDVKLLFNYRTLKQCANFYKEEAVIAKDILEEYKYYVLSGHIVDTYILFKNRPDEDMNDHRYW